MVICEKLIEEQESDSKFQDRRLIDNDKAIEAMKVANKQWEASVAFLVQAQWTRSEILEYQGKTNDSVQNYEVGMFTKCSI